MNLTVMCHFLLRRSELTHFFVRKEKNVVILLKMLGISAQNLVARATRRLNFVDP